MTEDQRSPGANEVEIAIAIDVPDPRTIAARDEGWSSPDGTVGANGTVDAARDQLLRGFEERPGSIAAYAGSSSRRNASVITVASSGGLGLS